MCRGTAVQYDAGLHLAAGTYGHRLAQPDTATQIGVRRYEAARPDDERPFEHCTGFYSSRAMDSDIVLYLIIANKVRKHGLYQSR